MEYRHQCPRLLSLDSSGMSWTRSLLSVYTLNRLWDVLQNTRGDSKKKLRLSKIQKEKVTLYNTCNKLITGQLVVKYFLRHTGAKVRNPAQPDLASTSNTGTDDQIANMPGTQREMTCLQNILAGRNKSK